MAILEYAHDAITLIPRERVCDYNRDPANEDRKIIDVDVVVAGQRRGTWRANNNLTGYVLHLELLDPRGAMIFAQTFGAARTVSDDELKATTAELLVANKLPNRADYLEWRTVCFLLDNKLKIGAAVLALIALYWFFRS